MSFVRQCKTRSVREVERLQSFVLSRHSHLASAALLLGRTSFGNTSDGGTKGGGRGGATTETGRRQETPPIRLRGTLEMESWTLRWRTCGRAICWGEVRGEWGTSRCTCVLKDLRRPKEVPQVTGRLCTNLRPLRTIYVSVPPCGFVGMIPTSGTNRKQPE